MFGGKKRFHILAQQIQGIEPVYMLQILDIKILGKLLSCSGDTKKHKLNFGAEVGQSKVQSPSFCKYRYFIHPASLNLVRYSKVFEIKDAK